MSVKNFKYKFSESQVAIIAKALKAYSTLHRSLSKELKPIREALTDLQFNGDDSYLIQAALDSTYCWPAESDQEIEEVRVKLMFYEQWCNQDKNIPKTWRSPKDMIKQEIGLINKARAQKKLPKVKY